MNKTEIAGLLEGMAEPKYREGMLRFGIDHSNALGVKVPELRLLAKTIEKDQQLSLDLWDTGIHECRLLASMIGDAKQVTREQIDKWTGEFYSWDICDQACGNLFDRTPFAVEKALEYAASEKEFVKRAGFVLMAEFAVHDKKADDMVFLQFFPVIEREAWDNRNFVKKAVNWALRQIGKRNKNLSKIAIETAKRIAQQNSKSARWIAADALRDIENRFSK